MISNYLHKRGYVINHLIGKDIFEHNLLQNKLLDYYKKYHKISTDINKIIKLHFMQRSLFDTDSIDEDILYLELNRLVGYSPIEEKKELV